MTSSALRVAGGQHQGTGRVATDDAHRTRNPFLQPPAWGLGDQSGASHPRDIAWGPGNQPAGAMVLPRADLPPRHGSTTTQSPLQGLAEASGEGQRERGLLVFLCYWGVGLPASYSHEPKGSSAIRQQRPPPIVSTCKAPGPRFAQAISFISSAGLRAPFCLCMQNVLQEGGGAALQNVPGRALWRFKQALCSRVCEAADADCLQGKPVSSCNTACKQCNSMGFFCGDERQLPSVRTIRVTLQRQNSIPPQSPGHQSCGAEVTLTSHVRMMAPETRSSKITSVMIIFALQYPKFIVQEAGAAIQ